MSIEQNTTSLQEILEALKTKAGSSGGTVLPTLANEAAASDLLEGKELIDGVGNIITGAMPMVAQAAPSIAVNSNGLITATTTQTAGYVSMGSKSTTKQLITQGAKTIIPSTINQTAVVSGRYTTGAVTVAGDSNLIPSSIKNGVSIFGVTGIADVNGVQLPELTNEGTAADLRAGKQLIDSSGNVIIGTSSRVMVKDVNFYDYDGILLYSYTFEEAQALTELPTLPVYEGLICQGWNYDLNTIKSYNRAIDVGATYTTDDGKTRLYIRIAAEGRMNVPLCFSQTVVNGVTIDWGDGSIPETLSGIGNVDTTHTYESVGDYMITLSAVSGCILGLGHNSSTRCVMGLLNGIEAYHLMLQKVEIGNSVTSISDYTFKTCHSLTKVTIPDSITSIGDDAFRDCTSLTSVTIGNSVTSIGTYAFGDCSRLTSVTIPDNVTSIGYSAFYDCTSLTSVTIGDSVTSIGNLTFCNCSSLSSITIPDSVTSIGNGAFEYCDSLTNVTIGKSVTSIGNYVFAHCKGLISITIPDSVTSIGSYAFGDCNSIAICDFSSHMSVPTLSHTDAFSGIPSDCVIKVPASLYDEWIAATNWSTYADYIVAV